ncbi:hypothetical protein [Ferruginibacter sp. SUN106]|uniref:hypothetical protein n=1 Tax=Ferruginibacter sp. SUN106 TaxID=2978348 RepID=UPI003D36DAC3
MQLPPTSHWRTLGHDQQFFIIFSLIIIGSGWTIFSQHFMYLQHQINVQLDDPGLTNIKSPNVANAHTLAAKQMKISIIIVALFCSNIVAGQQLSKAYVDKWVTDSDSTIKIDNNTVYFIGMLAWMPSLGNADSAISSIALKDLLKIEFYKPTTDTAINMVYVRRANSNNILIFKKGDQSSSLIKSIFKNANQIFEVSSNNNLPTLAIDDVLIEGANAKTEIHKIKAKKIKAIAFYDYPVPLRQYGKNGKGSLVQIWMK